jgi:hypothetical protein
MTGIWLEVPECLGALVALLDGCRRAPKHLVTLESLDTVTERFAAEVQDAPVMHSQIDANQCEKPSTVAGQMTNRQANRHVSGRGYAPYGHLPTLKMVLNRHFGTLPDPRAHVLVNEV